MGNGVTIEYIINKGSACIEAFRTVSHVVSAFFGSNDPNRRSKEIAFREDLRVLVEHMEQNELHWRITEHFIPKVPTSKQVAASAKRAKSSKQAQQPKIPQSAVLDVMEEGAHVWHSRWDEFMQATTYDKAVGWASSTGGESLGERTEDNVLNNDTVFDEPNKLHISFDTEKDVNIDECGVGGCDDFDTGVDVDN